MLIKQLLPESIKIRIKLLFVHSNQRKWVDSISDDTRNIFVFLCGFYQNLGDMAITFSQIRFLRAEFPDANIIPVPSVETYTATKTIQRYIHDGDLITVLGGGNMDDTYVSLENARLHIVKKFKHNRIVCFPQTYFFSNTKHGRRRESISKRVYEKNNLITIFVREQSSLFRIKKSLRRTDIRYCPDIVLSLRLPVENTVRDKVLLCLRNDSERQISDHFAEKLINEVDKHFDKVIIHDTIDVPLKDCQLNTYEQTLNHFWSMIRECKVVITDRLHCMIFCVINRTPCIVLDNSNHKISGIYGAWLRNIPYIKMVENNDIGNIISCALKMEGKAYQVFDYDFSKDFTPLINCLHE